jgi:CheY-like chemotaxis protein
MSGTGDKIMVVGDDSSFCYLMRRYALKSAHPIVFAYLGEDALALAQRENPAAIVLEVGLPGTMGWDVLRLLRAHQATCNIPVVLCSWLDEGDCSLHEDADVYLRKPILYEDFLAALADVGVLDKGLEVQAEGVTE